MQSLRFMVCALLLAGLSSCAARESVPPTSAPPPQAGLYVTLDALDVTQLLAPPPADPLVQKRDTEAVRLTHDGGTPEQLKRAEQLTAIGIAQFADVLGPAFATERLPVTTRFFSSVLRDLGPFISVTKECWRRPRPFVVDPRIVPSARFIASTGEPQNAARVALPAGAESICVAAPASPPQFSYSYPSGHAAFGALAAILLAELVPERRTELFTRGWEYGDARVMGGVHFPSDVEAGRILATSVLAVMSRNERFRTDLAAARREVRDVLGYR